MLPSSLDMNASPPKPGCLSDECLAGFLDGRLEKESRREATEHLAGCDDCRQLLIEAGASVESTPEHGSRWTGRLPALLAGFAIAAGLAAMTLRTIVGRSGHVPAPLLAARPVVTRPSNPVALLRQCGDLDTLAGHAWPRAGIAYGFGPTGSQSARGARLGVRLTDLEIAVALRDANAAQRISREMNDDVGGSIPAQLSLDELIPRVRSSVAVAVDGDMVTFGQWLEAARLATLARRPAFWSSSEPARILSAGSTVLPPPLRARLSLALKSTPPNTEDGWQALERVLEDAASLL